MHWLFTFALAHWEAFTAVVGGFFGATLGAFLTGYLGEKGKQIATKKDIGDVLAELRKVTTETESIKAQISGDTWLRQTVWVQKREAYAVLLKSLSELENSCKALTFSLAILQRRLAGSEAYDTQLGEVQKKREAVLDDLSDVILHFDTAALFDPTISAQKKALADGYGFEPAMDTSSTYEETKLFVIGLMQFRRDLLSHMRKQLGVPESSMALST